MNYILKNSHIQNPGKYLVIDSDMFLIDEFKTDRYDDYDCAYIPQSRNECNYMWNGLYYFNTTKMKNLELLNWNLHKYTDTNPQPGCGYWTDTGGETYKWIEQEKNNHKVKELKHLCSGSWNEDSLKIKINQSVLNFCKNDIRSVLNFGSKDKYFSEIYDDVILHYRAGGNWQGYEKSLHDNQIKLLETAIYDITKS